MFIDATILFLILVGLVLVVTFRGIISAGLLLLGAGIVVFVWACLMGLLMAGIFVMEYIQEKWGKLQAMWRKWRAKSDRDSDI